MYKVELNPEEMAIAIVSIMDYANSDGEFAESAKKLVDRLDEIEPTNKF